MEGWRLDPNMTAINSTNSFIKDGCPRKLTKSSAHIVQICMAWKGYCSVQIVPNELCNFVDDSVDGGFRNAEYS